ncbi:hypothetical protein ACOBQJ_13245 [Pelotomaculum propionicicum]
MPDKFEGEIMNKHEFNKWAVSLVKQAFTEQGFKIENISLPADEADFIAVSSSGKSLKIKVRAISQIGSYIFSLKKKFNIKDPYLYMAVIYVPKKAEKELYLIPASEWGKDIYPFKGKDYNKPGQSSQPEWGISFSMKAKDAMEPYRFAKIVNSFTQL